MNDKEQSKKAKEFAEFWKGKGYEKGQSQTFWLQLLSDVFGIDKPSEFIELKIKYILIKIQVLLMGIFHQQKF